MNLAILTCCDSEGTIWMWWCIFVRVWR